MKPFLAILLALSILVGCPILNNADEEFPFLGKGGFFPLEAPLRLTAWVVNTIGQASVKGSYVLEWIQEQTNITLDITQEFSGSEGSRQLSLMLTTTQELPDILLCTRWSKAECAKMADTGLIIPLDGYLADCANWNRLTEICGQRHIADLTMPDGQIYTFGSVNESFHLTHQARMWVYRPWVDALMDGRVPRSTEEFYNYLGKVSAMDPNGNGLADEIPLTGQVDEGWASDPLTFISNAFIHNNTIYGSTNASVFPGCYVADGKVRFNWVEEGYRDALRYLGLLFRQGLLDNQVFTQDGHQLRARLDEVPNRVGAVAGGFYPHVEDAPLPDGGWSNWLCLPPLEGPGGVRLSYQSTYDYFYNCNGLVTRDCKYPKEAVQLFDLLSSTEGTLVQSYGKEGLDWFWCRDDNSSGLNNVKAEYRFVRTEGDLWDIQRQRAWPSDVQIGSAFMAFRNALLVDPGTFNGEQALWDIAEQYAQFAPGKETVFPNITGTQAQLDKIAGYRDAIGGYVQNAAFQFIMGGLDIETEWDAYLSMLDGMGQRDYERILQEAYDQYQSH